MSYFNETTCQIVQEGDASSTLQVHEAVLGAPLCNVRVRPWHGQTMVLINTGAREVTCGNCARVRGAAVS